MTRYLLFTLVFLTTLQGLPTPAASDTSGQPPRELVLLNWSEYIDPEVVSSFEAEHSVKVRELYFEDDEDRDYTLVQNDGTGADLVLVDGTTLGLYVSRGWLAPLGEGSTMPNLRHLRDSIRDAQPHAREYGVPYFSGSYGIVYRSDLVPEPLTAWKQLLEPAEALRGKLAMMDDSRDLLTPALKLLGHSVNATEPAALAEAARKLRRQRPFVKTYTALPLGDDSALVQGKIWAATSYSGDALTMREHNENIEYVIPEEGTSLWIDYWAISARARSPDLARAFLDYINRPEIAARNAEYLYYPTPNAAAEAHLPAEYLEDPLIYPGADVLAKSEYYSVLSPRATRRYMSISAEITGD
jgi:spermidine/putrescine transport system substrate-binding protein